MSALEAWQSVIDDLEWELYEMEMAGDVLSPLYEQRVAILDGMYAVKEAATK